MNCLIIVNDSPWGSGLPLTAWRFAHAAGGAGLRIVAVFFREDGVYNAVPGAATDAGTPDLAAAWRELARAAGARLMVCRSSADRRLAEAAVQAPFERSGLASMFELLSDCDRVVSF